MRQTKIYTPLKAIRLKCLDCVCGSVNEVKLCPCTDCTLWPYRLGHRPKTVGYEAGAEETPEDGIDTFSEMETR